MACVTFKTTPWTCNLQNIYQNNVHTDVFLSCEGKLLAVHKTVLVSQSQVLRQLLSAESFREIPVILLEGFRYEVLMLLVTFLYNGVVKGSFQDLVTLSQYGKELKIEGLSNTGHSQQPLQLELLEERKVQVTEQLQKLQGSNTDSEDSASDEDNDELTIVFEKNLVCNNVHPHSSINKKLEVDPLSTVNLHSTASSHVLKRPLSPISNTSLNEKKRMHKISASQSKDKAGLIKNVLSSIDVKLIKCSICKEIFSSKTLLKSHLADSHSDLLTCTICHKLFSARPSLRKHLKNHIAKLDHMLGSNLVEVAKNDDDVRVVSSDISSGLNI